MPYVPPDPCGGVEFTIAGVYIPPSPCGGVEFGVSSNTLLIMTMTTHITWVVSTGVVHGGLESSLPSRIGLGSKSFSWKKAETIVDPSKRTGWDLPDGEDIRVDIGWESGVNVSINTEIPNQNMPIFDITRRMPWKDLEESPDKSTTVDIGGSLNYLDLSTRIPWQRFLLWGDISSSFPYIYPEWKDKFYRILWGGFQKAECELAVLFDKGTPKDWHHDVFWGPYYYSLWCHQKYYPPTANEIVFTLDEPLLEGVCEDLDFYIGYKLSTRCPYKHRHSGIRDKYIEIPEPTGKVLYIPYLKVYYMNNIVTIRKIVGGVPADYIDFLNVSAQIDRDSWLWGFNITVASKTYLNLIKPSGSTYVDVEITMNGHKWTCRVEGWRESLAFGSGAWDITGRSPSAELGNPYLLPESYINPEAIHGVQLVDMILSGTGYTLDWQYSVDFLNPVTSWLIPAGVFTYSDRTKIEAIKDITDSVGAYIQTYHDLRSEPKLIVKPKYNIQPWNWASIVDYDHVVIDAQFKDVGRSYLSLPIVNAVITSGVNAGVVCSVIRAGTAGDKAANMVVNSLITTNDAGRESARMVLGASGNWVNHTIRLFSLYPSGTEPGLLLPGDFIRVTENAVNWKGQVTGVNITASQGNGLDITQTVEIEEFLG